MCNSGVGPTMFNLLVAVTILGWHGSYVDISAKCCLGNLPWRCQTEDRGYSMHVSFLPGPVDHFGKEGGENNWTVKMTIKVKKPPSRTIAQPSKICDTRQQARTQP